MRFDVITLFPEAFKIIKTLGVTGRALGKQANLNSWNPRDYTPYNNKRVDDRPYGGGAGMVMMPKPLLNTLNAIYTQKSLSPKCVIYLSPAGLPLNQDMINKFKSMKQIILVAGRYEGIDQRFIDDVVDYEVSIGDYVLSGGELACMVLIDALLRQIEGVIGNQQSLHQESFVNHRLDYPQYTYPRDINNQAVPKVLLSGNHAKIQKWRTRTSILLTQKRRPDLLKNFPLTTEEKIHLEE